MPKRVLTGTVVSDKGDKTVVVNVERQGEAPALWQDHSSLSKKYHAHDEGNVFKAGETVRIEETRADFQAEDVDACSTGSIRRHAAPKDRCHEAELPLPKADAGST